MEEEQTITVSTVVKVPIDVVWELWTAPEHVTQWAFASDDWEAPHAENDLRTGGKFTTRMSAKDKSAGFDFAGVYTDVKVNKLIEYDMDDGRHVKVEFKEGPDSIEVVQTFDPENTNLRETQKDGWQAILDNFKKYAER